MECTVQTTAPTQILDVTDRVAAALPDDHATGACHLYVPHTTAGVVVNEAEAGLLADLETVFGELVPADGDYAHDRIDDNAAAHLRAMLAGGSITVPVSDGSLALGTWGSVLLLEFDGPRDRRLQVRPLESAPD